MWRVCSQNCVAKDQQQQQQLRAFSGVDRFMHCVDASEALQERRQRSPPLFKFVSVYPPDGSCSTSSSLSPSSSSNSSGKESHLVWSSCGYCHRNNQHSASSTRWPWTASDEGERCRSNRSGPCWDHLADRRRRIRFPLSLSLSIYLSIYYSRTFACHVHFIFH